MSPIARREAVCGLRSTSPIQSCRAPFTVQAYYSGDGYLYSAASAGLVKPSVRSPLARRSRPVQGAVYGQSPTITLTLSPAFPGGPTPTGTVVFTNTLNGNTNTLGLGTITTQNGNFVATLALSHTLATGTHTINAIYSGDNHYYAPLTTPVSLVVSKQGTQTTMVTNPNPVVAGHPVTLTATVAGVGVTAGAALPTGKVTFYDGTTNLGSATLVSSGGTVTATLNVGTLPTGVQSLTARYAGDGNYLSSTSPDPEELVIPSGARRQRRRPRHAHRRPAGDQFPERPNDWRQGRSDGRRARGPRRQRRRRDNTDRRADRHQLLEQSKPTAGHCSIGCQSIVCYSNRCQPNCYGCRPIVCRGRQYHGQRRIEARPIRRCPLRQLR